MMRASESEASAPDQAYRRSNDMFSPANRRIPAPNGKTNWLAIAAGKDHINGSS
jgi:hypothetical protein